MTERCKRRKWSAEKVQVVAQTKGPFDPNHPDREDYEHILDDPFNGPFDKDDIQ